MKKGITKITSCIVISLVILAGFTVMFSGTMDVQGENEKEEENMYYQFVQNVSIEENETYSEEDIEEELELLIEALGLDDGPRTNSEVDIMEWFASLDEDDWEALLDMDEDMEADGCGPVRHDTNGAEGPREREDEIEYNSPPGQINGGGGGGGSTDENNQCIMTCLGNGYSSSDCNCWCLGGDWCDSGGDDSSFPDPPEDADCGIEYMELYGLIIGYEIWCNKEASSYISTWCGGATAVSIVLAVFFKPLISIAIGCTSFSAHAFTCALSGKGVVYYQMFGSPYVTWCHSE